MSVGGGTQGGTHSPSGDAYVRLLLYERTRYCNIHVPLAPKCSFSKVTFYLDIFSTVSGVNLMTCYYSSAPSEKSNTNERLEGNKHDLVCFLHPAKNL